MSVGTRAVFGIEMCLNGLCGAHATREQWEGVLVGVGVGGGWGGDWMTLFVKLCTIDNSDVRQQENGAILTREVADEISAQDWFDRRCHLHQVLKKKGERGEGRKETQPLTQRDWKHAGAMRSAGCSPYTRGL